MSIGGTNTNGPKWEQPAPKAEPSKLIPAGRHRQLKAEPKTADLPKTFGSHRAQAERAPNAKTTPPNPQLAKKVEWVAKEKSGKTQTGGHLSARTTGFAAEKGDLEALKKLRERGAPWDKNTCVKAIKNNHMELLSWAIQNGAPLDESACAAAAAKGDKALLKMLCQGEIPGMKRGLAMDERTCTEAARKGHLDVLKWAIKHDAPFDSTLYHAAGQGGNIEMIEWIIANEDMLTTKSKGTDAGWGVSRTFSLLEGAAAGGHREVFEWAVEEPDLHLDWNGRDDRLTSEAAGGGHFELVKWLHKEKGMAIGANTTNGAARAGNLEMLQWARAQGAKWDHRITQNAAYRGDMKMIEWAVENGAPIDLNTINAAINRNNYRVLNYCKDKVKDWSGAYITAVSTNNLEALKWMQANGIKQNYTRILQYAQERAKPAIVAWAQAQLAAGK